jgi:S1-C subfamily serine protease
MKKFLIILLLITSLSGCKFFDNEETNPDYKTPTLVDGSNLADDLDSDNVISLEDALIRTIEFAQSATICVKNYQTIEKTVVSGGFWRPTYETVTEHLLYGSGSGVIYYKALTVDGKYLYKVITNEHVVSVSDEISVVKGEEEYKIYDEEYEEEITAKLIGTDAENDIAILEFISSREYSAVKFSKLDDIKAGKFVVAMGTPLDTEFYNTATYGIISRVKETYIQHDAAINSGNSGGPLFDLNGNLVGINNAKLSGSTSSGVSIEGIYFAIPINIVSQCVIEITKVDEISYR